MTIHAAAWTLIGSAFAATSLLAKDDGQDIDPCLFGVWEVVEWSDFEAGSNTARADHSDARGRFIYTPGGRMSVQVMLYPEAEPIKGPRDIDGLAKAARGSIEYFGNYSAEREKGRLIHRIEGSGIPNRRGRDAVRSYRITGNSLEIFWAEPDGRRFSRTLNRVENLGGAGCEG